MKHVSRTLHLHPDALFDQPYEQANLPVQAFETLMDNLSVHQKDEQGLTLTAPSGAVVRLDAFAPGVLRIRAVPHGEPPTQSTTGSLGLIDETPLPCNFTHEIDDGRITFTTDQLQFVLDRANGNFTMSGSDGTPLLETLHGGIRFSAEPAEYSGHRMLCDFRLDNEQFFGFGGRIMPPRRTGSSVDIFTVKVGLVSGDYGGFPVPFFLSTRGYGLFLNNPWPHVYFDMGRSRPDQWYCHAPGGDCDFFLFYGPHFSRIVQLYTQICGRTPLPAKWWLGFWCSSQTFEHTADVVNTARRMRDEGYPCDAMVLDGPWRGGPNFVTRYREGKKYISDDLQWHPEFGDGAAMIHELDQLNFHTCLHLNSRSFNQKTADREVHSGRLRRHGEEVVPRVTDPESEKFYEDLITPLINDGTALWWTDHSDRVSGQIRPGLPSRNLFGSLWNRLLTEIMGRNGHQNSICLTRGSGIGGQQYGLPWPGDTRHGIDAFQDDISFCLNAGMAGYALTSYDLAGCGLARNPNEGYRNEQEKLAEIFDDQNICRRLCQSLFFVPTPRIHNNWCSKPKFPWDCSPEAAQLFRQFLQVRYRLTPYIYSYALHAARTGEPILRPLVYHHRLDSQTYSIEDEFYMGDWLLIAPITQAGAESRNVYLPQGDWIHLWSDQLFRGPITVEIEAPLHEVQGLPVFVKTGAFLPWQPLTDSLNDRIPQDLQFDLYPNVASEFCLNESPDVTNTMSIQTTNDGARVRLENHTELVRHYTLNVHQITGVKEAKLDGRQLADNQMTINTAKQTARLQLEARPQTTLALELRI